MSNYEESGGPANSASAITIPVALRGDTLSIQYAPEIDPEELEMGIEEEKEHTNDPEEAKKIALTHLNKIPDYYTRLKKMETEASKAKEFAEYKLPIIKDEDDIEDEDDGEYKELGFADDGKLTVEAFKSGTHTDAAGNTKKWSDKDLEDIVNKGNEQLKTKPVPVVLGHPNDDSPAVGWIDSFKKVGGKVLTTLKELAPKFIDDLKAGAYKTRSISLYDDNRVRHLGFLGGVQPAIEGLEPFEFKEGEEEYNTIYFGEFMEDKWTKKDVSFLKRLLMRFGYEVKNHKEKDMSDKVKAPEPVKQEPVKQEFSTAENASVIKKEEGNMAAAPVASSTAIDESIKKKEEVNPGIDATQKVNAAEKLAAATDLAEENTKLKNEVSALLARLDSLEKALKASAEEEKSEKELSPAAFCENLIRDGKLKPADRDITILALQSMADLDKVNSFSEKTPGVEGGVMGKSNRLETYKAHLVAQPKIINFASFPVVPNTETPVNMPAVNMEEVIEKKMKDKQGAEAALPNKTSYWDMMKSCHSEAQKEFPKEYAEYAKSWIPKM